jgi:hypothetical protein
LDPDTGLYLGPDTGLCQDPDTGLYPGTPLSPTSSMPDTRTPSLTLPYLPPLCRSLTVVGLQLDSILPAVWRKSGSLPTMEQKLKNLLESWKRGGKNGKPNGIRVPPPPPPPTTAQGQHPQAHHHPTLLQFNPPTPLSSPLCRPLNLKPNPNPTLSTLSFLPSHPHNPNPHPDPPPGARRG